MGQKSSKNEIPNETIEEEEQIKEEDLKDKIPIDSVFKEFPRIEAPKDAEGFIQSFSVDQSEEYLKFFDKYGFVVINNILNDQEIKESLEEVWGVLEKNAWGWDETKKVKRDDPSTWENATWPSAVRRLGILGQDEAIGKMAWKNRQNPLLYNVYSTIMKNKKLWVSVDRWGVMRPTKGILYPVTEKKEEEKKEEKMEIEEKEKEEEQVEDKEEDKEVAKEEEKKEKFELVDKPEWKTEKIWLHWDLNPWNWLITGLGKDYVFENFISENNGSKNTGDLKLQGLVCLTESTDEDGGFCTVSGFHQYLKEWVDMTKDTDFAFKAKKMLGFTNVPKGDPMESQVQKISARAGSLIVWSSEQPHCNFPNNSNRFRINQYIKMFPAQNGGPNTDTRAKAIQQMIPDGVEITSLGKKLFGLKKW